MNRADLRTRPLVFAPLLMIVVGVLVGALALHAEGAPLPPLVSQCPAFSPCLSRSGYRDFKFGNTNDSHSAEHFLVGAKRADVALECSIRGRRALVTPLFGQLGLTTDMVSPLRKLSDFGLAGRGGDLFVSADEDRLDEVYEEALLSGLVVVGGHGARSLEGGEFADDDGAPATAAVGSPTFLQSLTNAVRPVRSAAIAVSELLRDMSDLGRETVNTLIAFTNSATKSSSSREAGKRNADQNNKGDTEEFAFVYDTSDEEGKDSGVDAAKIARAIANSAASVLLEKKKNLTFGLVTKTIEDVSTSTTKSVFGLANNQLFRRIYNTFIHHLLRIFGRVVTRIEYVIESNSHRQLIPTLKMFVVKPKRVLVSNSDHHSGDSGVSGAKTEATEEHEFIPDVEAKFARSLDEKHTTSTSSLNTASSVDGSLPLGCEAWEEALNTRLLHTTDAPDRDVFPDERTRRRQIVARYRRAQSEGLVEEVCRPFRVGWLPPWLQARFTWTGTESTTRLSTTSALDVCGEDGDAKSRNKHEDGLAASVEGHALSGPDSDACRAALEGRMALLRCEVSVPLASHSCLVVESMYRNKDVEVSFAQHHVWDTTVFFYIGILAAIAVLKPILVTNKYLQVLSAAGLGIFFVLIVVMWLVVRDLKKTRLGQAGIVALFSISGFMALSESVTNTIWYYLTVESRTNAYIQSGLVLAAVAAALTSRYLFYEKVPTITHYTLTGLQVAASLVLASHNREAAALVFFVVFVSRFGLLGAPLRGLKLAFTLAKWLFFILCWPLIIVVYALRFVLQLLGIVQRSGFDPNDAEPRETFPEAARQPRAFVAPLAREAIRGPTAEAKFRVFEQQGSEHTRRALRELGASIRRTPEVLGRLQDPNGVARYFGVSADVNGDFIASDDER